MIKDNLEKMQLKAENEQIHEKLLEFRDKYNALVAAKQEAQRGLLAAEEGKLQLQQLLLKVKMERTQEKEEVEVARHTLETRLIDAQNDVLEWEMREQTREKGAKDLGAEFDAANEKLRETESKYVALTESYKALQTAHEAAQSKVQALSVELLNLVNERNVLSEATKRLERELGEMKLAHGESGREAERLRASTRELETTLLERTEELTALREAKVRAELSLRDAQLGFDKRKLELDQSTHEFARERDTEVLGIRKATDADVRRIEGERRALADQLKLLEMGQRSSSRKIAELDAALGRKRAEQQAAERRVDELAERLRTAEESFRTKLLEYASGGFGGAADRSSNQGRDARAEQTAQQQLALEELLATYQAKERELLAAVEDLGTKEKAAVRKNRLLFEAFTAMRHQLEDALPEGGGAADAAGRQLMALPELPPESELRCADASEQEARMERELAQLRERLRISEARHTEAAEKALRAADGSRAQCAALEERNEELRSSHAMLAAEKKQLQAELKQLAAGAPEGSKQAIAAGAEQQRALKQMQDAMMRQISELQDSRAPAAAQPDARLLQEVQNLRAENAALSSQLGSGVTAAGSGVGAAQALASGGSSGVNSAEVAALRHENAELRTRLDGLGGGTMAELVESQRKCAELQTRNAIVEEELAQYKQWMEGQLGKFKEQLAVAQVGR